MSGISVDGDELSITLVEPSDDLLERLASTTFCVVPDGTPVDMVSLGTAMQSPDRPGELTIPSAGPYHVSGWVNGEYTVLDVNPNYAGDRPHEFDTIVLREGVSPSTARELLESGEWDGVTNWFELRNQLADGSGVDLAALCLVGHS